MKTTIFRQALMTGLTFAALSSTACATDDVDDETAIDEAPAADEDQDEDEAEAEVDPVFIDLPGEGLFPEGILQGPAGELYVTGFGDGSIVVVDGDDHASLFKEPGEDGLSSAVGMAIDVERNRLWVANFSFDTFTSNMKVFDLDGGDLVATVEPSGGPEMQFFNEVAIDARGRVYMSDTLTPTVWTADANLSTAEVLVTDPLLANPDPDRPFGLNGLALSPAGDHLVVSVMDRIVQGGGRLVDIDLGSLAVTDVELGGAVDIFGGSDGMFFEPGGDLLMVNVTPPAAIVTASFDADFSRATLSERGAYDDVYDRPTSTAIRGDRLVVVNSQLDHIIDDGNGAVNTPPQAPFQLVSVSLDELLEE